MRYLFATLTNHGYIYPAIAIGRELQRRGHDVAFVTGPDFGPLLAAQGFERLPRGPEEGPSFVVPLWRQPAEIARQVAHLDYAGQLFRPDVIIGAPLAIGPFIYAEKHHLPIGVLGFANYLWPTANTPYPPATYYEATLFQRYERTMAGYSMVAGMNGIPSRPVTFEDTPLLGDLFLLRSVPELEEELEGLPGRVHLIGDCSWEPDYSGPSYDKVRQWVQQSQEANQPILYIQHAGGEITAALWSLLVAELANKPVRVAGAIGLDIDLASLPPNFMVSKHIPYGLVLPYAHSMIGVGKSSIMLGALTHGLPMLLVVLGTSENVDVAERCQRVGAAISLFAFSESDITTEMLAEALQRLQNDPTLGDNARRLQQAFRQSGGPNQAADLLEQLGRTGKPILRTAMRVNQT